MAAQLIQMVTVVDKSGKAVNSSKHLVNVWKEAKAAYKERKAEVAADRQYEMEGRRPQRHRTIRAATSEDDLSRTSSRAHRRPQNHSRHHSHTERRRSGNSPRSGPTTPNTIYAASETPTRSPTTPNSIYPASHSRFSQNATHSAPTSPGIQRSSTAQDGELQLTRAPRLPPRSYTSPSSPSIDMNLAYGELPGEPGSLPLATRHEDEQEMQGLVSTVKRLLEEADCLHHSATKTIAMLQKNPDAMAAVALTLAEISNLAKKMAPGALMSFSKGAPAVFGLLASPQFLIAGGVAVGITIVAFGGYKIVKKIREQKAIEDPGMDEMIEIGGDANRIDNWRRGIAEEQLNSAGTSVDGEFITPLAAISKLNLAETKPASGTGTEEKRIGGSKKSSKKHSRGGSKASSPKAVSKEGSSLFSMREKKDRSVKKPSPLRLMFQ